MGQTSDIFNRLEDIQKLAKSKGADDVKVVYTESEAAKVTAQDGEIERIERPENSQISVGVYLGQKTGSAVINSQRPEIIEACINEAILNAKMQPDDPYAGLIDPSEIADQYATLDLVDSNVPHIDTLVDRAVSASKAAMSNNKLIFQASGASSWSKSSKHILASNGFSGVVERTSCGVQAVAIAKEGEQMQSDYDYDAQIYGADLKDATSVGQLASENALKCLNPRTIKAQNVPVVIKPQIAESLVNEFIAAMSGLAVLKNKSFLAGKLDKRVMSPNITIVNDPLLDRGLGSYAFDADGIAADRFLLVEGGELKTYLFGSYGARKFNDEKGTAYRSTGHAGVDPYIYMKPGEKSPQELISEVKDGFYLTELMNLQVNEFDGSFTSPASGFWIENGEIAYRVDGASIGGNLFDLFNEVEVGNDVDRLQHIDVPTLLVPQFKIG